MKDHRKDKEQKAQENSEQVINEQENTASENANSTEKPESENEERVEYKIAALNDKYLRLAAEFDNYRRRTAKERLDLVLTASEETIKGLLTILDDFERAIQVLKDSKADLSSIEGTELIYKKLFDYLKTKGLAIIEVKEGEFNTDFHEAIAQFPAQEESKKNKIVEIVQQGYTLNGKVIRFAKVVVGI